MRFIVFLAIGCVAAGTAATCVVCNGGGGGGSGLLSTAGKLVFGGDGGGNLVAYDATNGKPLWHSHLGQISNAPETYLLDGHQYILAASGDTLYAFTLY